MHIDLSGKRALVTGGNTGLGASIARALAKAGALVAINYISKQEDATALVSELRASGSLTASYKADVSDARAVEMMFAQMEKDLGGIDILVNNAGIDGVEAKSWQSDPSDWMRVIDTNLKGAYLCSREALKRMVVQKSGVVLNLSSVHEVIPWTGFSAYTASKAGLSMMAKSLSQEAAPFGVRVLCIAPGAIRTPINENVWSSEAGLQDLLSKIPLGRVGTPEDISGMVVVLSSDVARYITGTSVFIDGGMTDYPEFSKGG